MDYLTIAAIFVAVVTLIIFIRFTFKKSFSDNLGKSLDLKLNELFPKLLQNASEQLITMADQKLDAKQQVINADVTSKKEAIETLVKNLEIELKNTNQRIENAERERIGSFNQLKQSLENQQSLTERLSVTTENLRKVLSNNQLRGKFGEQVAEDLLRMAGFVANVDYLIQKKNTENDNTPDFTVLLPDKMKINIDVKFPISNLQRLLETEDEALREQYKKAFDLNVKDKIKQIATRDYINPEENTVDFAIMFIPNEMIFSYIYENLPDTWELAGRNKIIVAGPVNFTATLRMVRQSYTYYQYQKDISRIVSLIKSFEKEFEKYNQEFVKIGDKISSLEKQYNEVNSARTNKLLKTIDKIKIESNEDTNQLKIE